MDASPQTPKRDGRQWQRLQLVVKTTSTLPDSSGYTLPGRPDSPHHKIFPHLGFDPTRAVVLAKPSPIRSLSHANEDRDAKFIKSSRQSISNESYREGSSRKHIDYGDGKQSNQNKKSVHLYSVTASPSKTEEKCDNLRRRRTFAGFSNSDTIDNSESTISENKTDSTNHMRCSSFKPDAPTEVKNVTQTTPITSSYFQKLVVYTFLIIIIPISVITITFLLSKSLSSEKCHDLNITSNKLRSLEKYLFANVFGQHIAINKTLTALGHLHSSHSTSSSSMDSRNILVLSFHGWTGVGKNYISSLLSKSLSDVEPHKVIIPLYFPHSSVETDREKTEIFRWIVGNASECHSSIIIIDEVDKASVSVLTGLTNALMYMKKHESFLNKTILVMILSNSLGNQINRFVFDKALGGRPRETLTVFEFEKLFEFFTRPQSSEMEWYQMFSDLKLIDIFIPFLPLSRFHVKQCILKDIRMKGHAPSDVLIESIADELSYYYTDSFSRNDNLSFSLTGCKRVSDKVTLHLDIGLTDHLQYS